MEGDNEMSKKRRVNRPYSIYSVIFGVTVVLLFVIDYYAIAPGSFGGGIGFFSIVFISPIGLVFGLMGLKNRKNRNVALLGIGINLLELFYFFYTMTHFAP